MRYFQVTPHDLHGAGELEAQHDEHDAVDEVRKKIPYALRLDVELRNARPNALVVIATEYDARGDDRQNAAETEHFFGGQVDGEGAKDVVEDVEGGGLHARIADAGFHGVKHERHDRSHCDAAYEERRERRNGFARRKASRRRIDDRKLERNDARCIVEQGFALK